jgi:1,2-diacylglycerol 3-alpha-glucosyltransferase
MSAPSGVQNNIAPLKIAFLSAGLGRISRGFEISSLAWFNELKHVPGLEPRLFAGGETVNATHVFNCSRSGSFARVLKRFGLIHDGCRLEQITFALGFLPYLFFYHPTIIWLQEATLANMLLKFQRLFKFKYKILFCDGAPVGYEFANKFDNIIFLNSYAMIEAVDNGINANKCRVIPHICLQVNPKMNKVVARKLLNIAEEKFVILCVAAWNKHHKRIDYLINELAHIDSKDLVVLLCGQTEDETAELKEAAAKIQVEIRWETLTQEQISIAYTASDLFVLPSLSEALGAVLIEAGLHSLPVICHQHEAAKYIFGENYSGLIDLSKSGNLSQKITEYREDYSSIADQKEVLKTISDRFSKQKLVTDMTGFIYEISEAPN